MKERNSKFWCNIVKLYRYEQGLSRKEFSELSGISMSCVYKIENYPDSSLSDVTIGRLCVILYGSIKNAQKTLDIKII